MSSAASLQVALHSMRKQAEQVLGCKPVSSTLPCSLLQFLASVPVLTSSDDGLQAIR